MSQAEAPGAKKHAHAGIYGIFRPRASGVYVMHLAIKGNCARHGHLRVLPCTAVMISRAGSQRRGLHALPVSIANTSHRCTGGQRMLAAVVRRACALQGEPLQLALRV